MSKPFHPQILTASDLFEGDVIYRSKDGTWSRRPEDAEVLTAEYQANQALAEAEAQSATIIGPYLVKTDIDETGTSRPDHFREAFRARGPSNYPDHGKQAEL